MIFLQNKINEIKNIINTSPKSYIIYLFSFSTFISIAIGLFCISQKWFTWYINKGAYVFVPLIIFAFLLDAKWFIYSIAKTKLGQLAYTFLAFIAYAIAEVFSKDIIYTLTSADPEQFGSAIKFMTIIYFIPAWAVIISFLIAVMIILMAGVMAILPMISLLLHILTMQQTAIFIKIRKTIQNKFHFRHNIVTHIAFFSIGSMFFIIIFLFFTEAALNLIPKERIASLVLSNTSYYKNQLIDNNLTCKKIPKDTHIKFIGDNRVSILRLQPNIYDVNFNLDKNITFRIAECN